MSLNYEPLFIRPGDPRHHIVSAAGGFVITPSDSVDLTYVTRGIYVGSAGNLAVIMANGDTVTFVGISAGAIHPIQAKRVKLTGTTAGSLVGVY